MITHMTRLFDILTFIRLHEFSFNMTNSNVKVKKPNVAILRSWVKFKWSSSGPGHKIHQHFDKVLQGF